MRLIRMRLNNFRLYESAVFSPCEGITVLCGDNAQGKTAILEAAQLCCTGRSHRTAKDSELVRSGCERAGVEARVERPDGAHEIRMAFFPAERRQTYINGSRAARSGELMGHMMGVLFSPEDLRMVKDGPAERRRFVDMELSQLRPSYYYCLQRYNRALSQRGAVLRAGAADGDLEVWEEQLAENGAKIAVARRGFLETLSRHAKEAYAEVSAGAEELTAGYAPNIPVEGDEADVRSAISDSLAASRENDLRRGITTRGPHRDDVFLRLGDMDVRAYGSQGQQRTAALAMKLAEMRVMREASGEWPILMLDDVMSELDPTRRRKLLGCLPGVQTIVTCTDMEDLAGAEIGLRIHVRKGALEGGASGDDSERDRDAPDFLLE